MSKVTSAPQPRHSGAGRNPDGLALSNSRALLDTGLRRHDMIPGQENLCFMGHEQELINKETF